MCDLLRLILYFGFIVLQQKKFGEVYRIIFNILYNTS